MRSLGKILQVLGMVLLPFACFLELSMEGLGRPRGVASMLVMMVIGVILFTFGRYIEGYARS